MNKLKILFGFIALMWVSACTDFVEPAIPYSDFETGVYLRTLENKSPTFNFFDIPNQKFNIVVEAVGKNDGQGLVKDVQVYAARRRGQVVTPEKLVATIAGSEFGANPNRNFPLAPNRNYPAKEISLPLPATLTALGLSPTTVTGGDFIEYRLVLNTTDGKAFTNSNISSDVATGAFYASPFFYRIALVCPSALQGTFTYTTTEIKGGEGANLGGCGASVTGTVKMDATTVPGEYSFDDASFGLFKCLYADNPPGGSVRFTDACGKVGMKGSDRYGDSYSLVYVSHNDTELTFTWKNTYGDGGKTTLKRSAGTWPKGLN